MEFYANKMTEVLALPDGFKRRYMLSAFREMMSGYAKHFDLGDAKTARMTMPKLAG
jgi:anaerobic magnesium-protoporphyrin IX monomethyl ester cyclase